MENVVLFLCSLPAIQFNDEPNYDWCEFGLMQTQCGTIMLSGLELSNDGFIGLAFSGGPMRFLLGPIYREPIL